MAKKVFAMYLAKEGNPNSDACAKLDLPASPWELWDALDKVRLQTDDILYMEIEGYDAFEYLSPHLDGLDIGLNELNDLAALLSDQVMIIRTTLSKWVMCSDSSFLSRIFFNEQGQKRHSFWPCIFRCIMI